MKKLLTILTMFVLLMISTNMNAQTTGTQWALSAQGGYSWLNGVVGGDLQIGHFGVSGGWMPTKMPISGEKISSAGFALSLYSAKYNEFGYYVSLGTASNGYRYEDTNGGEQTSPMTIVMVGMKSGTDQLYFKLGGGYGWCDLGNAWTFEATLGINIIKSK